MFASSSSYKEPQYLKIWRFIEKEISAKFGKPKHIVSDKGRKFMSSKTQDYFKFDNINHLPTTPYYPQANGWVERLKSELIQMLQKLDINNLTCGMSISKQT